MNTHSISYAISSCGCPSSGSAGVVLYTYVWTDQPFPLYQLHTSYGTQGYPHTTCKRRANSYTCTCRWVLSACLQMPTIHLVTTACCPFLFQLVYMYVHMSNPLLSYHKIGLLVLFLQDIGDIVLEAAKTAFYFKVRGGKEHALPEFFANLFFAIFTIQQ